MNETIKTILSRRSIRKYTGATVSRAMLEEVVKAGMSAPTSRDTRHFRFVLVDDENTVKALVEGLPYTKMALTAKHIIIVATDIAVAYGGRETPYWVQDCSAAAENVLLAAQSLGLGACWTAAHPRPERMLHVQKVLEMPEQIMPLCVIAIGHPAGDSQKDKYDPTSVHWNKWGQK